MERNRGPYQSNAMVIAKAWTCLQDTQTILHSDEQNRSRCVSLSRKSLGRSRVSIQMLPVLALCWFLSAVVPALGQSTFGSVIGIVQDSSGAAVSGTKIVLHSTDENTERTVIADAAGGFTFENVKAGKYSLRANHDGFADTEISGISVAVRQDLRLTVSLTIAAQSTTVEVTSSGDQINTEDATLGDSKDNLQITQLPLNNRATTTSPLGALGLSPNVQTDSSGNIALSGASSSMVNFSVDGISTANVRQNGALQDAYPSQEGIAAVKVNGVQ